MTTKQTEKLKKALPKIKTIGFNSDCTKSFDIDLDYSDAVFIDDENRLHIHCECDSGNELMDYWGEYKPKEFPWIHPELQEWAGKRNMYWDWMDAAGIVLCES